MSRGEGHWQRLGALISLLQSAQAARLTMRQIGPFQPPNIYSFLPKGPKRVRILSSLHLPPNPTLRLGAVTAILTNPVWVVKVRTFTAPPNSPAARRVTAGSGAYSARYFTTIWARALNAGPPSPFRREDRRATSSEKNERFERERGRRREARMCVDA